MYSAVLIVPDQFKDQANLFGESMGWGPNNYSVPLSGDGLSPATYWGCRANVTEGFIELLNNPPEEAQPLLSVLTIDVSSTDQAYQHFKSVMDRLSLKFVEDGPTTDSE